MTSQRLTPKPFLSRYPGTLSFLKAFAHTESNIRLVQVGARRYFAENVRVLPLFVPEHHESLDLCTSLGRAFSRVVGSVVRLIGAPLEESTVVHSYAFISS